VIIELSGVGLAAFAKLNGASLIDFGKRKFIFESEKTEREWMVEYFDSCCSAHDSEVCNLRKLFK